MLGCGDVEVTGSLLAGLGISSESILCGSGSALCESSRLESLWLCSSLCYIHELKIPAGTGAAPAIFVQVSLLRPPRLPQVVRNAVEMAQHHPGASGTRGMEETQRLYLLLG